MLQIIIPRFPVSNSLSRVFLHASGCSVGRWLPAIQEARSRLPAPFPTSPAVEPAVPHIQQPPARFFFERVLRLHVRGTHPKENQVARSRRGHFRPPPHERRPAGGVPPHIRRKRQAPSLLHRRHRFRLGPLHLVLEEGREDVHRVGENQAHCESARTRSGRKADPFGAPHPSRVCGTGETSRRSHHGRRKTISAERAPRSGPSVRRKNCPSDGRWRGSLP
mmetsp:Transcript_14507/g.31897  ORF Transcript_14507/g.31897 Transcript_14507/m.31897 type:complete len:221 (-) Transcript_14507:784-1446(-)